MNKVFSPDISFGSALPYTTKTETTSSFHMNKMRIGAIVPDRRAAI